MTSMDEPVPGLVIRYAYLWRWEARTDKEEGAKDRPCLIVAVGQDRGDGNRTVWVAPITRRPPEDPSAAVHIPSATGRRLGLDTDRSWVVVSEMNQFEWPGPDIRPVEPGRWSYGLLPRRLFDIARERLADLAKRRSAVRTTRN